MPCLDFTCAHRTQIEKDVAAFRDYGDAGKVRKHAEAANFLMDDISQSKGQSADFNNRERVFGFPPTEYALLDELRAKFEPVATPFFFVKQKKHTHNISKTNCSVICSNNPWLRGSVTP